MEKKLKKYISDMDQFLKTSHLDQDYVQQKEDLLIQIGFFQQERLIHLLVTITFALLTLLSIFCSLFYKSDILLCLIVLLLILLIPYIRHYYILENGVQKLYEIYNQLNQQIK